MARCIHYKDGKFAIWSSIVADYVTYTMSSNECMKYLLKNQDHLTAYQRVSRAKKNGCSIIPEAIRCENINFDAIIKDGKPSKGGNDVSI